MYPADLGLGMPPEWNSHARTLMEWPVLEAEWPEPFSEILPAYVEILRAITFFEPVTLVVRPDRVAEATAHCGPGVSILPLEHNDSWMRDNGPTFVKNNSGEIAGINWIFNAWGGKFPFEMDNQVAPEVLRNMGIPCFNAPIVLEGGSIHVDGAGNLLTTESCLLNPNRNPGLSREKIETLLRSYLQVRQIIWLPQGWTGDDTDGHIDNVACFAAPGCILTQVCRDPADPNYEISQLNLEILNAATDNQGKPFRVIPIEQPPAAYYQDVRLTLSYLNFYFVNGGIVMPVFGGAARATDQAAIATMQQVFPDRRIVPVNGSIIARGGGNIHCLTQQVPTGTPYSNQP
ncbi:MAG TPA: agmatine deiminase family protein [Bacillota bacterium]